MTLEQLRIFAAVAEHLHFTRAAEHLNLTQSAVSSAISILEAQYGTPLFYRIGRRTQLTGAGVALLAHANAILSHIDVAKRMLHEFSGMERGRLHIHASQTIANHWLPARLHRFLLCYPRIILELTVKNTSQVAEAMVNGAADVGFIEGKIDEPCLVRHRIPGDRLILVVGTSHPWFGLEMIDTARLTESTWILREPGSGTRREFEGALRSLGGDPQSLDVTLELPSNEAIRAAVEGGAGATVLSELVVQSSLRLGVLHAIPMPWPARDFEILRHATRHRTRAERALVTMIEAEQEVAASSLSVLCLS